MLAGDEMQGIRGGGRGVGKMINGVRGKEGGKEREREGEQVKMRRGEEKEKE